ncbi:MAG: UDP-N-acetylglucosamine diphosphorylase/glucosamine-1-phosphate N-acetyltransferase [Micrococcales bacterium 73-15]|uniref:bifunctional UDP-N-acetylglucosamine diphosphorylase/glucosamine-1-phosphate N-acetyltransferase GlmU n=1 Tax=Salana multivorans TaxID=120377 RepID=UPI000967E4EA|nr:bifunctional UDP-N-acetylglucosamine diphosphorylase/glucosamine-1-phosphate N-acetyltransferase GlmU [Salana multivorans]OJX94010.1 MAG: UDP-N-acetylglucosamine diphosphorylase/glucosamine-1-phosphate N-acetyltransferase [Micrococcales bacterium 73-15]
MTDPRPAAVIVLAAGEGTRMRSATPKVLHAIGGRTLLGHVLATARALDPEALAVVVRHDRDRVAEHALALDPDVLVADQDAIKGTGRAAWCALEALDSAATATTGAPVSGPVVVLAGDVPLLDAGTLGELLAAHTADGNVVTVLTTRVPDPTGYGRIVRTDDGQVERIVEHRDASPEELAIDEINTSVYAFDADVLRAGLRTLQDPASDAASNAQGEVYLTDVLALAHAHGAVRAIETPDPIIVEGVNDRVQLATLGAELNRRVLETAMRSGVTVVDPASTWVDVTVTLEQDVTLLPGTQLLGRTSVATGAVIGPDTTLEDATVEAGARVLRSHVTDARIGEGASVGPYTHLRTGTVLGPRSAIGAFAETKNAELGAGAKVPHLSYVGDAVVGDAANIGAGVITANYDGVGKHRTVIGAGAFVGSDTTLVAPIEIGGGAFVAAGSTVTRDVAPGALAVERAQLKIIPGWVARRLEGTKWAAAAQRAIEALGESVDEESGRDAAGPSGTARPSGTDEAHGGHTA